MYAMCPNVLHSLVTPQASAIPSFTDEAKWRPHPSRGVHLLPGVWQGVTPFTGFYAGTSEDVPLDYREGIVDAVRWFAEDCDAPQGLQCLVDATGGFGSLAAASIQVGGQGLAGGAGMPDD